MLVVVAVVVTTMLLKAVEELVAEVLVAHKTQQVSLVLVAR
jgi:hypothetical protein